MLSRSPTDLFHNLLTQATMLVRLCEPTDGESVLLPDLDQRVLDELLLT